MDTGCNLENVPEGMIETNGERERELGKSMVAARHDDDNNDDDY